MKLRISHFFDPKPLHIYSDHPEKEHSKMYQKAYSAWKARNVKPEEPKSNYKDNSQLIWISRKELADKCGHEEDYNKAVEWEEYFKALQHYEENRKRYEGFEYHLTQGGFHLIELPNQQLRIWIYPEENNCLSIVGNPNTGQRFELSLPFISVSLFEQICEENGIQLNKIETK